MLEVPYNWSSGLRRSLVALLGTVAAEELISYTGMHEIRRESSKSEYFKKLKNWFQPK